MPLFGALTRLNIQRGIILPAEVIMKSLSKNLGIVLLASLLVLFSGCGTELKTFTRNWGGFTDGEASYSFLPEGYSYDAKLKKLVGYVDGGSAVYASEDGAFIKENESIFQDMRNNHLVRDDCELPVPTKENCTVMFKDGRELPESAKDDFFLLLRLMDGSENAKGFGKRERPIGGFYVRFSEPEGLTYGNHWDVYGKDGRLYLTDGDGNHALISESTSLYAELSGLAENGK